VLDLLYNFNFYYRLDIRGS